MPLNSVIKLFTQNPRRLFMADAIGALVTTISLSLLLPYFNTYFGMPKNTLYLLGAVACVLYLYSTNVWQLVKTNFKPYLISLVLFNITYCFISIFFLWRHQKVLGTLDLIYFSLELMIISFMIFIEWKVYRQLKHTIDKP